MKLAYCEWCQLFSMVNCAVAMKLSVGVHVPPISTACTCSGRLLLKAPLISGSVVAVFAHANQRNVDELDFVAREGVQASSTTAWTARIQSGE